MFVVVLVHLLVAALLVVARRQLERWAFVVGALGPLATLIFVVANWGLHHGEAVTEKWDWVPAQDLEVSFRVDGYALIFLLVVGGAGLAIFLYAQRYFTPARGPTMFAATMTLFAGGMVGLVASDHLLSLFVFWELTTISSYLLIGYDDRTAQARSAALHAALVTGAGGLAMLGGFVLLAEASGSYLISEIAANPAENSFAVGLAWVLILIGAVTKSAQFPFHAWLPGAMAAPTPASAFLHSATMVKAGIFLVGRMGTAAVATVDWWQPAVVGIGLVTMVVGGWRALRQYDLKLLLAFGTVSQLGFMFLLIGSGIPELVFSGLAALLAHALFKATLFMVVGAIDHEAGTRDLRRLSGLNRSMPVLFAVAIAVSLSMAAIPLTFGFDAKEAAFHGLVHEGVLWVAAVAGASVLTVAYTARFVFGAFGPHVKGQEPAQGRRLRLSNLLLAAPATLAVISVVVGFFPALAFPVVDAAAEAVTGVAEAGELLLWPGLGPPLAWSLASLTVGSLLAWRSDLVARAGDAVGVVAARLPSGEGTFRRFVPGLINFADRSSGLIQNGSLPTYVAIILLVAIVMPTVAVLSNGATLVAPPSGTLLEWVLGLLIVAFAVSLAFVRRRFAVVILLGGVGYAIAGLYAVFGAPDLTLTQLLIETLAVALFALVLRHLPATFARTATARTPRLVVALLVGAFVFAGGLVANAARTPSRVAETFLAQSIPEAGGSNVVNVILVDFRGFDTLGEITVLVAATLGAAGLIRPVIRNRRRS
ncbi:MAG: proton-conducting transporter membrane subunit [Acidimicrobiia bacterium]|nr:proton-conducting transporter membrane subunit [Acidimicrobiia bacterium]